MTLISSNSIFKPVQKTITYKGADIVVTTGANQVASLPLCAVKQQFEQYQRLSIQIPAGATDFVLNLQQLGIKTTFLSIVTKWCTTDPKFHYLKWKFLPSSDPKWSMTSVLTLTGTTSNPIQNLVFDNPSSDCPVNIEILSAAMTNDNITDVTAFLYLNGLTFGAVQTFQQLANGILAFYDSTNNLAGTLDWQDIVNVYRVPGQNRIIIDEASQNDIVLDFLTLNDTLQALSAINWFLQDPINRPLPQPADTIAPVITKTPRVDGLSNTIQIDLSLFTNNYTKQNFIADAIQTIVDNRDGQINATIQNIQFSQSGTPVSTITNPGNYLATITVSDLAGNIATTTVIINAQAVIVDLLPPTVTYTAAVTGLTIATQDLAFLPSAQWSHNDAKVLCILAISDNVDGPMSLSSIGVTFFDQNMVPVSSPITQEGNYTVRFSAIDSHGNLFTQDLSVLMNNSIVNTAPRIQFNTANMNPVSMTATISLAINYGSGVGQFTKTDAVNRYIIQILDDIDGIILPLSAMWTFLNNVPTPITQITTPGVYALILTVTDSGSNTTVKTINLTVTL